MKRFIPVALIVILLACLGCQPPNPLVGKWQGDGPVGTKMLADMKADGTYSVEVRVPSLSNTFVVTEKGTYTFVDGTYKSHRLSIDATGVSEAVKTAALAAANKEPVDTTCKMTFSEDKNTITEVVTLPNGSTTTQTLTRVKN